MIGRRRLHELDRAVHERLQRIGFDVYR